MNGRATSIAGQHYTGTCHPDCVLGPVADHHGSRQYRCQDSRGLSLPFPNEMPEQLDLLAEGDRLRDEGMRAVEDASDELAIGAVDQAIRHLNSTGEHWSANDLRRLLPDVRPPLIGARVHSARMRLQMRKVGRVKSTLPSTHSHEIAVWQGVAS